MTDDEVFAHAREHAGRDQQTSTSAAVLSRIASEERFR